MTTNLMQGKKILIVGIANDKSIAYGCAKQLRAAGADLAITYLNDKADDPIAKLGRQLKSGDATLKRGEKHGYLKSLLKTLDVPIESQLLVFSKTALNQKLIGPTNPRAIYFNDDVYIAWVPGAWEIPVIARRLATTNRYAAVICLGAVVRGETTHDLYINNQVSAALAKLGEDTGLPILFGLLTCNTIEQAINRAGGKVGNKGSECADAAVEMINLMKKLP